MALQIPQFNMVDPTHPTAAEWTTYTNGMDVYVQQVTTLITTLDTTAQVEATPIIYTTPPTNMLNRLNTSIQTTAWMYCLLGQHNTLAAQAAQNAATLAAAQQAAAAVQPAAAPNINQLLQMIITLQQQQQQLIQQQPPAAHVVQVKATPPNKFNGSPSHATAFLH